MQLAVSRYSLRQAVKHNNPWQKRFEAMLLNSPPGSNNSGATHFYINFVFEQQSLLYG